ncbi:triose-phosphate isomerase [Candidatus Woesearchaeota archaeon]|nr:triose-phosphate isomerase [Candidatus Woesearchaeota archaeon]
MVPFIVVNFKTYKEGTGGNAVKLAKMCEAAALKAKNKVKVAVAVQATDIFRVAAAVDTAVVEVFAQHIDANGQGKSTGFVIAEAVKEAGASGTLLNHAEHKITDIAKRIATAKAAKLATVVCAADVAEAKTIASLTPSPDYIAIELPELIGTLVSVSKANPEVITSSIAEVRKIKNIPVLCGAGIANGEDVRKAVELGTVGILVATAVVLAKNPEKALAELIKGIGEDGK